MKEKKLVKCVLGQRKKIARAMAIYACDNAQNYSEIKKKWKEIDHKEAEILIEKSDDEIEKWLDGGTVFPFVMDREVEQ